MAIELKVPEVGESITEVYIGQWRHAEGDRIGKDDSLVELESDKATFDIPSPIDGVLSEILKQPGDTATVGEVIAYLEQGDGKPASKKKSGAARGDQERPAPRSGKQAESADQPAQEEAAGGEAPAVMPAARRLLAENNLSPSDVQPSGPGGRILKEDVEKHLARREKADQTTSVARRESAGGPDRQDEAVPMSPLRRRIATRLVEAQQTAALLTTFNEIDLTAVKEMRERYRDAFQQRYGIKLGFMSFFVKAAIDALEQFPQLNGEIRDHQIVYHNYYDIGIAIGSGKGLVVPILRNAERMSFAEVELAINDFGQRARENRLAPEELQGGTFTISNGGVYGSLLSTPIVNPPQSGVLGMHAIQDRPVVVDGQIVIRPMMYVALTYDHRIVDGREAVTFLKRIKETVEDPARILLEV